MKKIILIIGVVVLLSILVIGVIVFMLSQSQKTSSATTSSTSSFSSAINTTSTNSSGNSSSSGTISLQTTSNTTVTAPDFTKGKTSVPIGSNATDMQYNLTPYPPYTPGQQYPTHQFDVQFNSAQSQFIVTLNQDPIGDARSAAEAYLSKLLGMSESQLCQLNIIVSVPYSVNEQYGQYENLGLDSCSGATALPQ